VRRLRRAALLALLLMTLPETVSRAEAQGVTLDGYRAAETPLDGFAVTRPRTLGHLGVSASLHLDYGLDPLRAPATASAIDHELAGQVGGAIGFLDRFLVAVRLPVVLYMGGAAPAAGLPGTRDPGSTGPGLGDLALSFRYQLYGAESDTFALALQTEATVPLAEAASSTQDLAGEAGVTFTPELAAELRFAPVRITANVGARFREAAVYRSLRVQHELTWALAVGWDIVRDVFEATLEGYGTTALERFANSDVSPVELLLGLRVRPVSSVFVGLAGGLGLGNGYGAPEFRGVLMLGYADMGTPMPAAEEVEPVATVQEAIAPGTTGETETPIEVAPPPEPEAIAARDHVLPPDPGEYGQLDRDGDRIVDAEDHCVLDREDYDEIEDRDGCPETDADADTVLDAQDMCPTTPGVATATSSCRGCPELACITERGAIVISDRVEFATGSDRILPSSEPVLHAVLAILDSTEDVARVRIEGHTDDRGRDQANIALSRARAASVRRWLEERGIPAEQMEAWGCGELHPLATGTSTAARQTNRRVEFFVVDPMPPDLTLREGCLEAPP
jgi:outer membrane protein OmpA-like peptidoglycan-associated protein